MIMHVLYVTLILSVHLNLQPLGKRLSPLSLSMSAAMATVESKHSVDMCGHVVECVYSLSEQGCSRLQEIKTWYIKYMIRISITNQPSLSRLANSTAEAGTLLYMAPEVLKNEPWLINSKMDSQGMPMVK